MRVISLFSGAGGMDLGFERAGHHIVWANDMWADAVATYRHNLGEHIHLGSLEEVSPVPVGDVVIGGFPCQGFSVANRKRHVGDQRNRLYLEFLRIVREKRPLYFVAENVKGLLSLAGGSVLHMILRDFAELGYMVSHCLLNAADYGVPQRRERVFIVGYLKGVCGLRAFPPSATHAPLDRASSVRLKPWIGVGEALAGLPEPSPDCGVPNHQRSSQYKLRFNGHLGHRVVSPQFPAPTITARGDDRGGVVVIHHPTNERRITPREAATIQGFPSDFAFSGCNTSAYRQIANAVPPPLAQAVAGCLPRSREEALSLANRSSRSVGLASDRVSCSDQLVLPVLE